MESNLKEILDRVFAQGELAGMDSMSERRELPGVVIRKSTAQIIALFEAIVPPQWDTENEFEDMNTDDTAAVATYNQHVGSNDTRTKIHTALRAPKGILGDGK